MDGLTQLKRLQNRWSALETRRASYDAHAHDIARYIQPFRGRVMLDREPMGGKKHQNIINGTGTWALRTCASGLRAGTASPSVPWFRLATEDLDLMDSQPVKVWLEWVEKVLYRIFAASNFYEQHHNLCEEIIQFGTAPLAHDDDRENIAHFQCWTWGDYACANDDRGYAKTVYRRFYESVENLARKYGKDRLSVTARNLLEKNPDAAVPVIQAIEPLSDRWTDGAAKRWAYPTAYFEEGRDGDTFLRIGGHKRCPVHVSRWNVILPNVYGTSPCMEALGDVKQLMHDERRAAQVIDNLGPLAPLQGPALQNGVLDRTPGAYNPYMTNGPDTIRPLVETNPQSVPAIEAKIARIEERINHALYADLFLMLAMSDRRQITATEIVERHEEKLLVLGPVLTRLNNEELDPVIERLFGTIIDASMPLWPDRGIVPPPPKELADQDIKIEYISSLQQAQRMVQMQPLERFIGISTSVAQLSAIPAPSNDKIEFDQLIDHAADLLGVSPRVVRDDEEARAMREQRQAMQAAQQAAETGGDVIQKLGGAKMTDTALGAVADQMRQ